MKKIIWIVVIIVMLVGTGVYFAVNRQSSLPVSQITNFEECAQTGYPILESYPAQCRTPDGKHFVEDIVKGTLPPPGPITISGSITCLPKKGSGPQTMECAIGLKGLDGQHFC